MLVVMRFRTDKIRSRGAEKAKQSEKKKKSNQKNICKPSSGSTGTTANCDSSNNHHSNSKNGSSRSKKTTACGATETIGRKNRRKWTDNAAEKEALPSASSRKSFLRSPTGLVCLLKPSISPFLLSPTISKLSCHAY